MESLSEALAKNHLPFRSYRGGPTAMGMLKYMYQGYRAPGMYHRHPYDCDINVLKPLMQRPRNYNEASLRSIRAQAATCLAARLLKRSNFAYEENPAKALGHEYPLQQAYGIALAANNKLKLFSPNPRYISRNARVRGLLDSAHRIIYWGSGGNDYKQFRRSHAKQIQNTTNNMKKGAGIVPRRPGMSMARPPPVRIAPPSPPTSTGYARAYHRPTPPPPPPRQSTSTNTSQGQYAALMGPNTNETSNASRASSEAKDASVVAEASANNDGNVFFNAQNHIDSNDDNEYFDARPRLRRKK